ncbi:glycosyl transferase [Elizabethkingia anophelis]|nr:glycosyl transferase [Elizabethkingia anophelis]MCT3884144.1 glycosyl transferase [Elizabethkingia anophelis]MCT3930879.1 glycosyl transferase [Elizabethkingia anophelis]MCT4037714.1 glycosyl transferase [Elizabethkingia anophelis]MCT4081265.1 glycosyl transferase [Elizabethkingia anophelis]
MKMKHAYLIIVHHEFEVLKLLLQALDDSCNDIYIHFDKKNVENIPILNCKYSGLYILDKRIDVRWGHVSQIETEYELFEKAYKKDVYSRYHLISGTHMPLKSQKAIHEFFEEYNDREILSFIYTNNYEVTMKLGRYHFFLKNYKSSSTIKRTLSQFFWRASLKFESIFRIIKKPIPKASIKANNWVSLTPKAVKYIIEEKKRILNEFKWSFCGDEYFVPYLLENKTAEYKMMDDKRLLFNEFLDSSPRVLKDTDYDFLIRSEYLFARKFSQTDLKVVQRILQYIKTES